MTTDPLELLRKHYTAEQVQRVVELFDVASELGLCSYFAEVRGDESVFFEHPQHHVQQMRRSSYRDVPAILRELGGTPGRGVRGRYDAHDEYFWPIVASDPLTGPTVDRTGQQERLTMLAFMLTWLESP